MNTTHLRTFLAVAQHGSFSKAARSVHVSQSTASLHVRELEDALGAALLVRQASGARPTPAGEVLIRYAGRLLNLQQEATAHVRACVEDCDDRIVVAASPIPAEHHLPRLLAQFRRTNPRVRIQVRPSAAHEAGALLRAGACELAFTDARSPGMEFEHRAVGAFEVILVGTPEVVDGPGPMAWIAEESPSATAEIALALLPADAHPAITAGSAQATRRCALEGAGVAFVPRALVEDDLRAHRLREVPWPGTPVRRQVYAVRYAQAAPTPAVRALLALLDANPG